MDTTFAEARFPLFARRAEIAGLDPRFLTLGAGGFAAFLNLYAPQPLLRLLTQGFHCSPQAASLTITATTLAVAVASPFAGALAGRLPRRFLVRLALGGMSVATFLAALSPDLPTLVFLRFVQGLFLPLIVAMMMSFVGEEWPSPGVGRAMSVYVAWTVVGGFSGRFLVGLAAAHFGWRLAFFGLGLLLALSAWVLLLFLPERSSPLRAGCGSRSGRPHAPGAEPVGARLPQGSLRDHFAHPGLVGAFASGFNVLFALVGTFTYVSFYLSDAPFLLGPDALGLVFCVYLVGVVVTPVAGRVMDRVGFATCLQLATTCAALGLLITLVPSLTAVMLGLALSCTGAFICQAAASGFISREAAERRASALGVYLGFYYLGGSCGAAIPGWFYHLGGWPACVLLLVAVHGMVVLMARRMDLPR